jgi:Holliday junction resolvase RusA-like endonuclease
MTSEAAVRVEMPSPPSTNALYSGRRFKTEAYKAWIRSAGWTVKLQSPGTMPPGRLRVLIEAPLGPRRDVENLKAVSDLLVTLGIIADDRLIDDYRVVRVPQDQPMTVSIWPM